MEVAVLAVPIIMGVVSPLVSRLVGDELSKYINREDNDTENIQAISDKLGEVEGTLKGIKAHSLSGLTPLPGKLFDALVQCPYEIEELMEDMTGSAKPAQILQNSEGVLKRLKMVLEIIESTKKAESSESASSCREQQGSSTCKFMRVQDKEAIVEKLQISDAVGVAIIGIAGTGKKTLAQAIADDPRINNDFHCVPLKSSNSSFKDALESFNLYRFQQNKKTLILLHDLQSVDSAGWNEFQSRLRNLNRENKVLITSQRQQIAANTGCIKHCLRNLPQEECISLILNSAKENTNLSENDEEDIRRNRVDLAEKCKGLPLLANHMGRLLFDAGHGQRLEVIKSRVLPNRPWEIQELRSVLRNMRWVSLLEQNPHLQRCVAYCSIFPQGYPFGKDNLVILWMAEGFTLYSDENEYGRRLEENAKEGFEDMLSYSIFETPESLPDEEQVYKIHDLLYDWAQHVASNISRRVHIGNSDSTPLSELDEKCFKHIRHLSLSFDKTGSDRTMVKNFLRAIQNCVLLRTFLLLDGATGKFEENPTFFQKLSHLRVLDLTHANLTQLSIKNLIQLRYLNLSYTPIKKLPSLSKCPKLQVVDLMGCKNLRKLPKDLVKLTNLISLKVNMNALTEMPRRIGNLKYLERLDLFIVGKKEGREVAELKAMNNLTKSLRVRMLENVKDDSKAQEAMLHEKKRLDRLVLEWSPGNTVKAKHAKKVLEGLKPPKNLKQLKIRNYNGSEFPEWIAKPKDWESFETIHLDGCKACSVLPPLGQFKRLKTLHVDGMKELTRIGYESIREDNETAQPGVFLALEELRLSKLPKLTELKSDCMPRLRELIIKNCTSLAKLPPMGNLTLLETLQIDDCQNMKELPTLPSSLKSLFIDKRPIDMTVNHSPAPAPGHVHQTSTQYHQDEVRPPTTPRMGDGNNTLMEVAKQSKNQPTSSQFGPACTCVVDELQERKEPTTPPSLSDNGR